MSSPEVELAKNTIEKYVKSGNKISIPDNIPDEMKEKAGVFVSIKKHGELRGCIGTFIGTRNNIAEEIIENAIAASTQDPRFSPVKPFELADLEISVDVLTAPEQVESTKDLDAKKYGVIIKSGTRKGLLLPDLEGVTTPQQQIAICRQKACIGDKELVELYRFSVRRFH